MSTPAKRAREWIGPEEMWSVERIKPYPGNARTHPKKQIEQIAKSITTYGWTSAILVDEHGVILHGHGRRLGAEVLKLKAAPVRVAHGWSEKKKAAYRLADNRIALNSAWDEDALRVELAKLGEGFEYGDLGFSRAELNSLNLSTYLLGDKMQRADEVVPLPKIPKTKPGDLYLLGSHRVLCGDATDAAHVARLLGGREPILMVTDPPYGVNYDPNWRHAKTGKKVRQSGKVQNDDRADWTPAWQLFTGDVAYVWHAARFASVVDASLASAGFEIRNQIIWKKSNFALARGDYHWQHEPLWYAVRKGRPSHWNGSRKCSTVWSFDDVRDPKTLHLAIECIKEAGAESTVWEIAATVDDGASGHGTQKPVECMRRPVQNNSAPGDAVYDPFVGSGTTVIACEIEERSCYGIEIDPKYVDVVVTRWERFTGRKARLDAARPGRATSRPIRKKVEESAHAHP